MTDKFDHDKKGAGIASAHSSHPAAISHSHAKPGGTPASVADLSRQLREGIHQYLQSETWQALLKTMAKFHHYSLNNSILITLQTKGKASQVASFSTWKALGRNVNKGEKGIKIFSPLPYRKQTETVKTAPAARFLIRRAILSSNLPKPLMQGSTLPEQQGQIFPVRTRKFRQNPLPLS